MRKILSLVMVGILFISFNSELNAQWGKKNKVDRSKLQTSTDRFSGITTYSAEFKTKSLNAGTHTYKLVMMVDETKPFKVVDDVEKYVGAISLRIDYNADDWLFMKYLKMKNFSTDWEKEIKWNYFDRKSDTSGYGISEWILVFLSLEEAIEILEQETIDTRLMGDKFYDEAQMTQNNATKEFLKIINNEKYMIFKL